MTNEEFTEEFLMQAHKLGILNEVLDLALCYIYQHNLSRYDALYKAFNTLKKKEK